MLRLPVVAVFALLATGCATTDPMLEESIERGSPVEQLTLEPPVKRAYLPEIRDWRVVDRDHIVLWHTRNRPYLIQVRPSLTTFDRTSLAMGVRRTNNYLTPFDHVVFADGFRHQITDIWELTREQADQLSGRQSGEE